MLFMLALIVLAIVFPKGIKAILMLGFGLAFLGLGSVL